MSISPSNLYKMCFFASKATPVSNNVPISVNKNEDVLKYEPYERVNGLDAKNFCHQPPVKITDRLYRGGRPFTEEGIRQLKEQGINTVISFERPNTYHVDPHHVDEIHNMKHEKELENKYGITLISIPMSAMDNPTPSQIQQFKDIVSDPNNKTYIHCKSGRDRTGIMCAIYDVDVLGKTYNEAANRMLSQNHNFASFTNLDKFLYNYCEKKQGSTQGMNPEDIYANWTGKTIHTQKLENDQEDKKQEIQRVTDIITSPKSSSSSVKAYYQATKGLARSNQP